MTDHEAILSPLSAATTRRVLITAGPTFEPIDEVRYLANRSSGRMGVALAEAAVARGLDVTLLLGPAPMPFIESTPIRVLRFQTTADLARLLDDLWPGHDLLLMAAAVADYRPEQTADRRLEDGKLRRTEEPLGLRLVPTPDLLAAAARTARPDQTLVGFALEPAEGLIAAATDKLHRKGVHAIIANPLQTMDAETITATLVLRDGTTHDAPPGLAKPAFAEWLLDRLPAIVAGHRGKPDG